MQVPPNYNKILNIIHAILAKSIESTNVDETQRYRLQAIKAYENLLKNIDITEYLLLDANPDLPKKTYIESHFNLGTLYKTYVETEIQHEKELLKKRSKTVDCTLKIEHEDMFYKAINNFVIMLRVNIEDELAIKQIVSVYTQMCFMAQNDMQKCIKYLQEALLYAPTNETIHYNLAFVYQKLNKLELAVIHYKLSIHLSQLDSKRLCMNNYNGLSSIYRSIKQWPEACYYLRKAELLDDSDPDIQNQLGVVYTEMRRTDLAEQAYLKAIRNYQKTFISTDPEFLHSELYLNYGHMHSYNGDNEKAIECYNKSLQICPKFNLPFQNKIMNLSYFFDQLEDKMYILNQHKLVNRLYEKGNGMYKFEPALFKEQKINVGIISGDFVDHPVSFFISTFLKHFDHKLLNLTCYSECLVNTNLFNKNLKFKFIKNLSARNAANLIYNDKIHILIDLSGHTALNRLDIFALKPCPIQISYIGYPYSTGLAEMDYRITDNICDNDKISQPFYTEKLVYLKNCFLCYNPIPIKIQNESEYKHPDLAKIQPFLENNYITIGCYNRVNKITDSTIKGFNKILLDLNTVRFIFKTKALINKNIRQNFLKKFDKSVHSRIIINDCTTLHEEHLTEYNKLDIAIDTFPYSGTTTSCEALYMGVPVLSLYDTKYYFHATNVTCSILKNSDLNEYVCESLDDMILKIKQLETNSQEFWKKLKQTTRNKFLNGKVCNQSEYISNIQTLLQQLTNVN